MFARVFKNTSGLFCNVLDKNVAFARYYSKHYSPTNIRELYAKNASAAFTEFKKSPTAFDAAFLISKADNVDESFLIYNIAKKSNQANSRVLVELILSCSSTSNMERANELWDDLVTVLQKEKTTKLSPYALRVLMYGLCNSDRVEQAISILKQHASPVVLNEKILNLLINSCGESNLISEAQELFESMETKYGVSPNIVLYNSVIKVLAKTNHFDKAMKLLKEMENKNIQPDNITYTILLSNCFNIETGKALHKQLMKNSISQDVHLSSALVEMYCKCGDLVTARKLFDKMVISKKANIVTWSSIINGYGQNGMGDEALHLFEQMQKNGIKPNSHTLGVVLNTCAENGMTNTAFELFHSLETKFGLAKNAISYSCIIKLLVKQNRLNEAIEMLKEMEENNIQPNNVTYTILLTGCAESASLNTGKDLHQKIISAKLSESIELSTSLIDMYCKCGDITTARKLFDKMVISKKANIVTWSSIINGYGQNGMGDEALHLFEQMQKNGTKPDSSLITIVLNACSHCGLISKALDLFSSMKLKFGIEPKSTHITAVVDVLSRSGQLDEAENFLQQSSFSKDVVNWRAILGGCRKFNDVTRAERVFDRIMELDPYNASSYVLLSNIYSATNQMDKRNQLREQMDKNNVKKIPGKTFVEVNGTMHTFYVEDKTHPEIDLIYLELKKLNDEITNAGYVPDTNWVTRDIEGEEEKKDALCKHSEKLAITYALIKTPPETPILITKNLRVCGDCHEATKFISKVKNRSITVRDANRFHHFKDGKCSCGDFW